MTRLNKFLFSFISLLFINSLSAQTWPKTYGEPYIIEMSFDVEEAYDGGYYMLGNITDMGVYKKSWLIKTDRNGNVLWEKIFSDSGHNLGLALNGTKDGGILLCGYIRPSGASTSRPSVIKLNACGEKEWCRMFSEELGGEDSQWASDVKETPSGDIIVLVNQYGEHPIETMHLFKLNADGEVLWRNPYASAYNHPGSLNPSGNKLLITSTNEYMIAGDVYWKDPWNPGGSFALRPLFVLIDSMGIEKWVLPFGLNDAIHGQAYNAIEVNNHFIGIATEWPDEPQIIPMFIKFDMEGNVLNSQTFNVEEIDSTFSEGHFGYIIKKDTFYFLSGSFEIGNTQDAPITNICIDTNIFNANHIVYSKAMYMNQYWPYSSDTATNENFLTTSTNSNWDISLSKLKLNLEYDTLDPGIYTYDSLCTNSGLPQSGFISLDDCDLFVDIDEIPSAKQYQESIRWIPIKAYPNPVKDGKLSLEFENTRHHQNMELRCYDDFGRQVHSQTIYKGQQDTDVDVSSWSAGIYVAVMYSNGGARGKVKFLIAK